MPSTKIRETKENKWDFRIGYRSYDICEATGLMHHNVDQWAVRGLLSPSVIDAHRKGYARCYSHRDLLIFKIIVTMCRDLCVELSFLQDVVTFLRTVPLERFEEDWLVALGRNYVNLVKTVPQMPVITVPIQPAIKEIVEVFPDFVEQLAKSEKLLVPTKRINTWNAIKTEPILKKQR